MRARVDAAIAKVYPALVRIQVVSEEGAGGRMNKQFGSGSGTIITPEGHVLTNHHVAGRGTRFIVRMANREEIPATLVATDAMTDLAVIKLDLSKRRDTTPLAVARFGDSAKLKVGDTVLAMGSPVGVSQSVTEGIVANMEMILPGAMGGMELDGESVGELVRWIGHDAVIYHGNSGGPLVNLDGEIIGVNEVGLGSLGGAIPGNLARGIADSLITNKAVQRSWSGIVPQPLLKTQGDRRGVLVAGVIGGSPAEAAGLKAGDILTSWDGVPVHADAPELLSDYNQLVARTPVGKSVTVSYERNGGGKATATLKTELREPTVGVESELPAWGITARDISLVKFLESGRKDRKGVVVHSVRPGGPCSEAKPALSSNDIIVEVGGKPVANAEELRAATRAILAGKTEPEPTLVAFERGGSRLLTVVKVGFTDDPAPVKRPQKAWMGVKTQVLTADLAKALGMNGKQGVIVTRVLPDTEADKADVKVGDILLKLDGSVIEARRPEDAELFENLIRQYPVDGRVDVALVRAGKPISLEIPLQERPAPAVEYPTYRDRMFEFTVRDLSFNDRVDKRLDENERGVLVTGVIGAGWGYLAGLKTDDVLLSIDGKSIDKVDQVKAALDAAAKTRAAFIMLKVRRGITTLFLEMEPDWAKAQ